MRNLYYSCKTYVYPLTSDTRYGGKRCQNFSTIRLARCSLAPCLAYNSFVMISIMPTHTSDTQVPCNTQALTGSDTRFKWTSIFSLRFYLAVIPSSQLITISNKCFHVKVSSLADNPVLPLVADFRIHDVSLSSATGMVQRTMLRSPLWTVHTLTFSCERDIDDGLLLKYSAFISVPHAVKVSIIREQCDHYINQQVESTNY